ncbi:hypothetical protein [Photobacterium sp. GSS17]|uniref:hypothetical protein n=1 Tax=Photobacterium sp. GSS17 TaxID=3020715 RepID=UPI00235F055F|nr:hypothetical protein [Photobacterium sp. GSS17]
MKFRKLKVKIFSEGDWYGFEYEFESNLNIIRGDNSSGKSTLVSSLIYSIGMEEIIGSKGPSSLPYALRTHFESDGKKLAILESMTLVEIENSKGEIITFKRYINSESKDTKLVQVIYGDYLTQKEGGIFDSSPVYLHDANSATNTEFGFYAVFEKFLGIELPKITDNKGTERKLYLQYIFASMLIEQKRGWTNYIANIPYYGISGVVNKTVSYLLNLDTFEKEKKLNEKIALRNSLTKEWSEVVSNIKLVANNAQLTVRGLDSSPKLDFKDSTVYVGHALDTFKSIDILLEEERLKLEELNKTSRDKLREQQPNLAEQIEKIQDRIDELITMQKMHGDNVRINESKLKLYSSTLSDIEDELEKNKITNKLNRFGADFNLPIANDICATCHSPLDGSLQPQENTVINMTVDENIKYLTNQKSMVNGLVYGLRKKLEESKSNVLLVNREITRLTKELSSLKRDIKSVENVSEVEVRRKVLTENQIEKLTHAKLSIEKEIKSLVVISDKYSECQGDIQGMNQYEFSYNDNVKLSKFEDKFRTLAELFSYRSAKPEEIEINRYTLIPYLKGIELREINDSKVSDIKADSSASDFVRLIWSYLISICYVSSKNNGNHLGLLLFDEPAQHSMSLTSMNKLLLSMSELSGTQTIVAASFEQSDAAFEKTTENVKYNYIRLPSKLIQRLNS